MKVLKNKKGEVVVAVLLILGFFFGSVGTLAYQDYQKKQAEKKAEEIKNNGQRTNQYPLSLL